MQLKKFSLCFVLARFRDGLVFSSSLRSKLINKYESRNYVASVRLRGKCQIERWKQLPTGKHVLSVLKGVICSLSFHRLAIHQTLTHFSKQVKCGGMIRLIRAVYTEMTVKNQYQSN